MESHLLDSTPKWADMILVYRRLIKSLDPAMVSIGLMTGMALV